MIPALVLTAGLATRLQPLSLVRAKAALPIAGEPLVGRILRGLAGSGVRDVVLNLHHLPASITGRVGDGTAFGVRVRYSWESSVLGSAGGPRRAAPLLGAPTFLVANGDTLASVDLVALVENHRRSGALVTMAGVPHGEPDKYGGIVADDEGRVRGFVRPGSADRSLHFVGVQVVEAAAFDSVPLDTPYESVWGLYPTLLAAHPGCIRMFQTQSRFRDIGTPADYLATALDLAESRSWGARTVVDPTAVIEDSLLWDDVIAEANITVRGCVVTDGVRLPAGSAWHNATIRIRSGGLCPEERLVGDLVVGPMVPTRT